MLVQIIDLDLYEYIVFNKKIFWRKWFILLIISYWLF